ncbi:MAG: hypothetical protein HQK96_03745 [Nitrospirae bacterium]|nr:hypothetical protein [Nitrospirota bacterium]
MPIYTDIEFTLLPGLDMFTKLILPDGHPDRENGKQDDDSGEDEVGHNDILFKIS